MLRKRIYSIGKSFPNTTYQIHLFNSYDSYCLSLPHTFLYSILKLYYKICIKLSPKIGY